MVADAWQDMFLHAVKYTVAPLSPHLKSTNAACQSQTTPQPYGPASSKASPACACSFPAFMFPSIAFISFSLFSKSCNRHRVVSYASRLCVACLQVYPARHTMLGGQPRRGAKFWKTGTMAACLWLLPPLHLAWALTEQVNDTIAFSMGINRVVE